LPASSQQWGRNVDDALAKLAVIEAVARRICADFGIDFSDPTKGLNQGDAPSIQNPVQLKLPSLKDLDIRDAVDGDLLTFDGKRGVWVARRHDTVQLPKEFPAGDPDSYYVPAAPEPATGVWSSLLADTNWVTDPTFHNGIAGWTVDYPLTDYTSDDPPVGYTWTNVASISPATGGNRGDSCMKMTLANTTESQVNYATIDLPGTGYGACIDVMIPTTDSFGGASVYANIYLVDAGGNDVQTVTSYDDGYFQNDGVWQTLYIYGPRVADYPTAVGRRLVLRVEGNLGTGLAGREVFFDKFGSMQNGQDYFDGDSTEGEFTAAWTGTPHASTSVRTTTKQINVPELITLGVPFTVLGRGFAPGVEVDVYDDWYSTNSLVTTDASGNFTTTLTIAANTDPDVGPVAGPGYITARVSGAYEFAPTLDVTYQ
jgi:hypothetical protein